MYIKDPNGNDFPMITDQNESVERLKETIERIEKTPVDQQRLIYKGKQLADERKLSYYNIQDSSVIHLVRRLRAGKPVIVFYPPKNTVIKDIDVKIESVQDELTHYYPKNDILREYWWKIQEISENHIIVHCQKHHFLFWEADIHKEHLLSMFYEEMDKNEVFCIHADKMCSFLEKQLTLFGFPTLERDNFITTWIHLFENGKNNLIYFIPQEKFSSQFPLTITGSTKPDKIIRMFMVFFSTDNHLKNNEYLRAPHRLSWMNSKKENRPKDHEFTVLEWGACYGGPI